MQKAMWQAVMLVLLLAATAPAAMSGRLYAPPVTEEEPCPDPEPPPNPPGE
jgi:hypothetical protein